MTKHVTFGLYADKKWYLWHEMEKITRISIGSFGPYSDSLDYMDADFVTGELRQIPVREGEVACLDCFLLLSPVRGSLNMNINGTDMEVTEKHVMVCPPNTVMYRIRSAADLCVKLIGISGKFFQNIVKIEKDFWETVNYFHRCPILFVGKNPSLNLLWNIQRSKATAGSLRYRHESLGYLFSAMVCEIMEEGHRHSAPDGHPGTGRMRRPDHIFKEFTEAVAQDNGEHRTVAHYAHKLCVTPHYLSVTVREVSGGRTPSDFIHENAVRHIKHELKHSAKSIKEIATLFKFQSLSSLGKYVRQKTGMSPQTFRDSITPDKTFHSGKNQG